MNKALSALVIPGLLLAACASSSSIAPGVAVGAGLPPPDISRVTASPENLIAPLDVLEISVFQIADLNRTVTVDSNGQINLPLVGVLNTTGKTANGVAADIAAKLQDGYVLSPQVAVSVKESPSQRITVEGAVQQPGVFPVSGRTTLLQAVAMARGVSEMADEKRVAVFRNVGNKRAVAVFDLTAIRQGSADDPQVFPNDVVVIEQSGSKKLLGQLKGVIPMIGVFRWF